MTDIHALVRRCHDGPDVPTVSELEAAFIQAVTELETERKQWRAVSGALCDAGNIPVYDDDYAKSIRLLTVDRDRCRAAVERLTAEITGLAEELRAAQKQVQFWENKYQAEFAARLAEGEIAAFAKARVAELAAQDATVDRLTAVLQEAAAEWKRSAEDLRLRRGQQTREKKGHEVLVNCACALEDMLAALYHASDSG